MKVFTPRSVSTVACLAGRAALDARFFTTPASLLASLWPHQSAGAFLPTEDGQYRHESCVSVRPSHQSGPAVLAEHGHEDRHRACCLASYTQCDTHRHNNISH